jgi:hypothetical protein
MSLHTLRNVSMAIVASLMMFSDSLGQVANAATATDRAAVSTGKTSLQIAQTDSATNQVLSQLRRVRNGMVSQGFRGTHEPFIGNLGRGGDENITLNLRQGTTYLIAGVCDNDCGDLDLELYDGNGNRLAVDRKADSIPIVSVTPRWNARFTVKAIMPRCANEPCRFGIETFGR